MDRRCPRGTIEHHYKNAAESLCVCLPCTMIGSGPARCVEDLRKPKFLSPTLDTTFQVVINGIRLRFWVMSHRK